MIKYEEMKKNKRLTDYEETKVMVLENYIRPNSLKENKKINKTEQQRFSKR